MKQRLKIGILFWSLAIILGAIGLWGCNKDDEYIEENVYKGYIQDIYQDGDLFTIRVTKASSNQKNEMPEKNDLISITLSDFPNLDLKTQQKLSFRIISASPQIINCMQTPDQQITWHCKISIIKFN